MSKQVLSQFLVVIAICRKHILEQTLYIFMVIMISLKYRFKVKTPVQLNFLLLKRDVKVP